MTNPIIAPPEPTAIMPMTVPKDLPILEASQRAQGEHLKMIRTTLDFTRNQFCDELDVTLNTLTLWENGKRPIGNLRLVLYACAYLAVRRGKPTTLVFQADPSPEALAGD